MDMVAGFWTSAQSVFDRRRDCSLAEKMISVSSSEPSRQGPRRPRRSSLSCLPSFSDSLVHFSCRIFSPNFDTFFEFNHVPVVNITVHGGFCLDAVKRKMDVDWMKTFVIFCTVVYLVEVI